MYTSLDLLDEIFVDMRVVMISDYDGEYAIGPENPMVGTEYFCGGSISEVEDQGGEIWVEWDNGSHNTYLAETLAIEGETSPPVEGRCQSIWS